MGSEYAPEVRVLSGALALAERNVPRYTSYPSAPHFSAAVGPAQAASRSLLARVTPDGMQGEIFGLYATTGRVVSFLSPLLWTVFIGIGGATHWGILGITIVLALGLVLLLMVKLPRYVRPRPLPR